jgi:hypothetical protein
MTREEQDEVELYHFWLMEQEVLNDDGELCQKIGDTACRVKDDEDGEMIPISELLNQYLHRMNKFPTKGDK